MTAGAPHCGFKRSFSHEAISVCARLRASAANSSISCFSLYSSCLSYFRVFVIRFELFSALSAFSAVQDFVRERLRGSVANWEFLCGRHFQLIQEFMEGSGGEVDHRGFGPKGYFVSIFQLIGLV